MQPGGTAAAAPVEKVFDVGIDERLSVRLSWHSGPLL
jgi:hypothetical protein